MPQAAVAVVTAIKAASAYLATASAAAAAGTATLTQTFALLAANVAISAGVSVVSSALTPGVGSSSQAVEWTADPDAPMRFPAGRVGVAGQIVNSATFGPDKRFAGFIAVVGAAGPIKGFVSSKFDDTDVLFDGNGKAITSDYAGELFMRTQRGLQPTPSAMTVPPGISTAFPTHGADAKLNGKPAYMLVLAENSKRSAFGGKVPVGLHTIEGLYGWDPAQDSTYPGGAGPCRLNDPATWVYLTNPIRWALKWALGLWEGPTGKGAPQVDYQVGGIGAKLDGIDVAAFVEAAAVADANGWTVAAWPSTDDDKAQVLDAFLQAGGAIYAEKAGKISCVHRAAPRASVATITAADTAGPIEIDTAASRLNRINALRPRFWSEAHSWQMTAIDEVTSTAWQIEDGQGVAVKRTRGVDYNFVPNAKQCAELAALQIAHTREGITGKIPLRPYMQGLDVGDAIVLDEPDFVLDGLKCLILNVEDDTAGDIIRVTFVSESDGKYPFAYGQTPTPPPAPTLSSADLTYSPAPLPGDWDIVVRPPDGGGVQQPGIDITGLVSSARASRVLVEYGGSNTGPWTQAYEGAPTTEQIQIVGLSPGATYFVAITYFNAWGNPSERTIYGPYTAPALVAGDVSPSSPTIADINDRYDDLVAAYGDTVAAEASASAAAAAADAAEAARASAVVARDAAGGSATAAAGSASTASTKAGEAASSATASFNSASAANNSAGAATSSAAAASTSQAAAQTSATLAARVGTGGGLYANAAPSFAATAHPGGAPPDGWRDWSTGWDYTSVAGQVSDKALRYVVPAATDRGIAADTTSLDAAGGPTMKGTPGAGWWVAEFVATLESGTLIGSGGLLQTLAGGAGLGEDQVFHFGVLADSTGAVPGAGVAGRTYSFSQLFKLNNVPDRFILYAMPSWGGLNNPQPAKTIVYHFAGIRRATAAEIETGVARAGYGSVSARISAEEAARASETAALAMRATTLEARARTVPNLIRNSDFAAGMRGWSSSDFGTTFNPSLGSYVARYSSSDTADTYLLSTDLIPIDPSTTYSLSFSGDGGAVVGGPDDGATAVYCSQFDASGTYLPDGDGYLYSPANSRDWNVRQGLVSGVSHPSARFVRIAVRKSRYRDGFGVSRIMLNWGAPAQWNDDATTRDLSARTSITETSIADAQAKLAVARISLLAEATGGRPARFIIQSDSYGGSFAALDAAKIYFGDNSVFDDVSDTLQTVTGSIRRVIAWGSTFGPDGLFEWVGDSSVALSAMTRANAQFYMASTSPYIGAPALTYTPPEAVGFILSATSPRLSAFNSATQTINVSLSGPSPVGDMTYKWEQVGGDACTISSPNAASTVVNIGHTAGGYAQFRCTASDTERTKVAYVRAIFRSTA